VVVRLRAQKRSTVTTELSRPRGYGSYGPRKPTPSRTRIASEIAASGDTWCDGPIRKEKLAEVQSLESLYPAESHFLPRRASHRNRPTTDSACVLRCLSTRTDFCLSQIIRERFQEAAAQQGGKRVTYN
jgi:hypothetical protein